MVFIVEIDGQVAVAVAPKYPFASSAVREVATSLGIQGDRNATCTDESGETTKWIVSRVNLFYVRPQ